MSKRMEKWTVSLIDSLDKNVDEETRAKILEQCGRQCQTQSLIQKACKIHQRSKNMGEFIDNLSKVYKHLHREGDKVYITYPRCYCSFVNRIDKGAISWTWCNCSRGWAKQLFETALNRPVNVILEKSIIRGDAECRFRIQI